MASVNTSVSVPDSVRELYQTSYLYGFFSSAVVFVALHAIFPASAMDEFVKNDMTAEQVQQLYEERWDSVALSESRRTSSVKSEKSGEKGGESQASDQEKSQA